MEARDQLQAPLLYLPRKRPLYPLKGRGVVFLTESVSKFLRKEAVDIRYTYRATPAGLATPIAVTVIAQPQE
jgi:hypothetical protein